MFIFVSLSLSIFHSLSVSFSLCFISLITLNLFVTHYTSFMFFSRFLSFISFFSCFLLFLPSLFFMLLSFYQSSIFFLLHSLALAHQFQFIILSNFRINFISRPLFLFLFVISGSFIFSLFVVFLPSLSFFSYNLSPSFFSFAFSHFFPFLFISFSLSIHLSLCFSCIIFLVSLSFSL